jgi:hypothetical protein
MEVFMDIVNLPKGMGASYESDCISIQMLPGGRYSLNGSVLAHCGDMETIESVALIGGDLYESYEAAESAGLAWADDLRAETLYVSRSAGTRPLPDTL